MRPAPSFAEASLKVNAPGPYPAAVVQVYANPPAVSQGASITEGNRLPVGSVLAKEKFATRYAPEPELCTVMEKTADTGTVDDWRFTMITLPDRKIVRERPKVACASCHDEYDRTDFVSERSFALLREVGRKRAVRARPAPTASAARGVPRRRGL